MAPKKKVTVESGNGEARTIDSQPTIPASAVLSARAATPIERKKEIENKIMSLAVGYGDTDLIHVLKALGFAECDASGKPVKEGEAIAIATANEAAAKQAGGDNDNAQSRADNEKDDDASDWESDEESS